MSEELESMVKMIVDSAEDQRRMMIGERLKMIASQPEEQRVNTVKGLILAASKLDDKNRMSFVRARTEAVAELPSDARKAIQRARVNAGGQISEEVNQKDMILIMQTIQEWPEEKRKMFKENLGAVFKELGMEMPDVESMMQTMAEPGAEMKKSRWKFW